MASRFGIWRQKIQHHPFITIGILMLLIVFLAFALAVHRWGWDWTGLNRYIGPELRPNQQYRPEKTLWDWLQLLIIPLMLAIGGFWLNQIQKSRDARAIEQRDKTEREITLDKQREDLLQTYLDRMSELLLKEQLRSSEIGAEVRNVARVRTITILTQLDVRRLSYVFTFLREAGLMLTTVNDNIVSLKNADFHAINWSLANLLDADLRGTNLLDANLRRANLSSANLSSANLLDADLSVANLHGADLKGANLWAANLRSADLRGADLRGANLPYAKLNQADFRSANLSDADLHYAELGFTHLSDADLDAYFRGTDLSDIVSRSVYFDAAYQHGGCGGRGAISGGLLGAMLGGLLGAMLGGLLGAMLSGLLGAMLGGLLGAMFGAMLGAILGGLYLSTIILNGAKLSDADLRGANLHGADLHYADLSGANLLDADLSGADLRGANLHGANLSGADLRRAIGVTVEELEKQAASLKGTIMPDGKMYHNSSGADLGFISLSRVDLSGVDLSGANLEGITGITIKELEKQAASLQGAIMPDGSKHP